MSDSQTEQKSIMKIAFEYLESGLGSVIVHALLILLILFTYPLLYRGGGGGGGSGFGAGQISVSLLGAANGTDKTGNDGISKPGAEKETQNAPRLPDNTRYTRPDTGLAMPVEKSKPKTIDSRAATAETEKAKKQAGAAGMGGTNPGHGIGTGNGNGAGSGEGNGVGSGKGNGVGNGIGDGQGDGYGISPFPSGAFSFTPRFDCGKDDANMGNIIIYTVELKAGDDEPKVDYQDSKFQAAENTIDRLKGFIARGFDSSAISSGEKKKTFKGVVRCNCNTSECKLIK